MDDLIARLEKATEGSRELDSQIAQNLWTQQFGKCRPKDLRIPTYTTSIDAAMTLVPEGVEGEVRWWKGADGNTYARACIDADLTSDVLPLYESATVRSPALALCIAALKARESSNG